MRWLALEAGDAATWGSTVVTFGMACYAIAQGIGQKRDLRRQNDLQAEASQLQRRQIETAERRTLIMEQMLAELSASVRRPTQDPYGSASARTRHRSVPGSRADGQAPGTRTSPDALPLTDDEVSDHDLAQMEDVLAFDQEPRGDSGRREANGSGSEPDFCPRCGTSREGTSPLCEVCRYDFLTLAPTTYASATGTMQATPAGTAALPRQTPEADPSQHSPTSQTFVPDNPWRLERLGQHGYALRNIGPDTITGVHVSRVGLPSTARGVPERAVVRPGEAAEFLMAATWGQPLPDRIRVSWHGRSGEVDVAVPEN